MMRRLYPQMAPVYRTTGLALALFLVPGLAAAGPTLSGSFQADAYGTLELKTEGEHVSGRPLGDGVCRLNKQDPALEGDFEGSVLVARLTLCQTGELCPKQQTYTVLGFYNEEDQTLVAHVRLSKGCQAEAVQKSGRFVLMPVSRTGSAGGSGDAAEPDSKRGSRSEEAAKQALQRGNALYQQGKISEAMAQFRQSLEYDSSDSNWPAYLGRGSCLLKLGYVSPAIKDLEKARAVQPQHGPLLYVLGCAYAQKRDKSKALDSLRSAVNVGYELHASAESDPDLMRYLGSDQQFKELLKASREKSARGAAASGTPSP